MKDQEQEVKFYVSDLTAIEARLVSMGAELVQPRTHEINLRFDTADLQLTHSYRVLRLRQDTAARLTYKGPGSGVEGVRVRQEIEFVVGDFAAAQAFLQALGYRVTMMYEKYRRVYDLGMLHITLDEMPYGLFVEIEGPDPYTIKTVSQDIGLDWHARAPESYVVIHDRLCRDLGLTFRDLSFKNYAGLDIGGEQLNLDPADEWA